MRYSLPLPSRRRRLQLLGVAAAVLLALHLGSTGSRTFGVIGQAYAEDHESGGGRGRGRGSDAGGHHSTRDHLDSDHRGRRFGAHHGGSRHSGGKHVDHDHSGTELIGGADLEENIFRHRGREEGEDVDAPSGSL